MDRMAENIYRERHDQQVWCPAVPMYLVDPYTAILWSVPTSRLPHASRARPTGDFFDVL